MRASSFLHIFCAVAAVLSAASCRQSEPSEGTALPAGKYPLTLQADVRVAATRAGTPDGDWRAGDAVSVRVGDEVRHYTPSSEGSAATLTAAKGNEPFYWKRSDETKTVCAWYCGSDEFRQSLPQTWTVESSQSFFGYAQSDFLYAPAVDIQFGESDKGKLSFHHQTARVDINIVNAEAATTQEHVSNVRVGNDNVSLTADYQEPEAGRTVGTWSNHKDPGTITPHSVTPGSDRYVASYSALVIPQDMTGKRFIAVTLADGNTYYYIPSQREAVLEGGKRYTYNITVEYGLMEVELTESVDWNDQTVESTAPEEVAAYRITPGEISIPDDATLKATDGSGNVLSLSNGAYTTYDKAFNLTLRLPKGQLLDKFKLDGTTGSYTLTSQYTDDSGSTYTYRFSDIASDINLGTFSAEIATEATPSDPKICDFYYLDGTWSTELRDLPCIGVVFWRGDPTADDPTLEQDHPECTHGLVLAIDNAAKETPWQSNLQNVQEWLDNNCPGEFETIKPESHDTERINWIQGYNNTKAIERYNEGDGNASHIVETVEAVKKYRIRTPTPPGCSGWYLPSIKELSLAFGEDKPIHGYGDIENIMFNFLYKSTDAPFKKLEISISDISYENCFWSSTEFDMYFFNANGVRIDPNKDRCEILYFRKMDSSVKTRCVLAF